MSAAQHEASASGHEAEAARHRASFDPAARAERERCSGSLARNPSTTDACWASTANATEAHLREAERHRRMAADHRAASQALRDAEARACAGLRDADRDMSPFSHREDIAGVEPLTESVLSARQTSQRLVGAIVTFRAVPAMTAEWLQRLVDCHLARAAALGHEVPEMAYCPLMPRGASARVSSTGNGFTVAIRGEDEAAAREVLRRVQQLTPPSATGH